MRHGIAISSACLLLLVGLTAGRADDRPAPATRRCELVAFPPPRPTPAPLTGWRLVAYHALEWLDRAETPDAALKRLGGTRLLMRADASVFRAALLDDLRNDVRCLTREARIAHGALAVRDGGVELRLRDIGDLRRALYAILPAAGPIRQPPHRMSEIIEYDQRSVDISLVQADDGLVRLIPNEEGYADRLAAMLDRSVEVIAGRIKNLGIAQAGVERDGADRILIRLPGVTDASRLVAMLGARARLELRLVDTTTSAEQALKTAIPLDDEVLYGMKDKIPYLVSKKVAFGGDDLIEAYAGLPDSGGPYVYFRFDARGTEDFARVTRENVGRPFAIVLDNAVISAPIIREPILSGSGQITGGFTVPEAHDLAILLRSGALPVKLNLVEQQTVQPAP